MTIGHLICQFPGLLVAVVVNRSDYHSCHQWTGREYPNMPGLRVSLHLAGMLTSLYRCIKLRCSNLLCTNNQVQSENGFIRSGTSNSQSSLGSLPSSGNEKVGSWCHWQTPFAQSAGLNWERGDEGGGGEGGEGARSEFSHVYITAQDISQSLAKLLKFPGSRAAECWKEAQAFTYSPRYSLALLCSEV